MRVTVKALITYCDILSRRLNQRKHDSSSSTFPLLKVRWISPVMGMTSPVREPGTKGSYSFMNAGARGEGEGMSKSEKVLRTESEWRKVSSSFPSPLPLLEGLSRGT